MSTTKCLRSAAEKDLPLAGQRSGYREVAQKDLSRTGNCHCSNQECRHSPLPRLHGVLQRPRCSLMEDRTEAFAFCIFLSLSGKKCKIFVLPYDTLAVFSKSKCNMKPMCCPGYCFLEHRPSRSSKSAQLVPLPLPHAFFPPFSTQLL